MAFWDGRLKRRTPEGTAPEASGAAPRACDLAPRANARTPPPPPVREAVFVRRHADDWRRIETTLRDATAPDPDALADGYVRVGDDLAYAKTFYPGSPTAAYLNDLSSEIHSKVYRNRREERGRFWRFWTDEIPLAVYRSRRAFVVSFLLFWGAFAVGALSASGDGEFARMLLGDPYVWMTEANIADGDPFAVYKDGRGSDMTAFFVWNNTLVAFMTFIGLFSLVSLPAGSLGTAWMLVSNGIVIGAFFQLFAKEGLVYEWFRVVFIHGMPELTGIVVAGGAGLTMWDALLFPGTYPRLTAFKRGALRGIKICVALVPVFAYAAFLEGNITRRTEMPHWLSWTIIGLSGAALVYYFVIRPWQLGRREAAGGGAPAPAPGASGAQVTLDDLAPANPDARG